MHRRRVAVADRSSGFARFAGICVFLAVLLTLWHAARASAGQPQRPPNFLVLIADDYGWHDIGYHGSEIRTPHLDRLARDGVRLERHYVYPTCSPTRAGLFTGCNPSRFGILSPIDGRSEKALPQQTANLATLLKSRGYFTALAGKWHLGLRPEVGPRQYGFEQTYGYFHGQIDQYTHHYKNGDRTWHRNDAFLDEEGHATDLIAAEAVRIIGTKPAAPLLLWVAFSVPHHPVQEEEKWLAPYKDLIRDPSRRLYAACVSHMDAAVGQIVEALEKSGQIANTLILFTGDNGGQKDYASTTEYEGKHGPYPTLGDNRPLRGWKGELYEGGVRVPAFVSWRDRLRPRVLQETVSYLDWFPTFAHLAGAQLAPQWKLEGRNVWPLLAGEKQSPPATPLCWETPRAKGVLDGDWKLIVSTGKAAALELYHLADDPAEQKNLAAANPGKVEQLRSILAAHGLHSAKP
jgi:arylsulfatase A-like enzyme